MNASKKFDKRMRALEEPTNIALNSKLPIIIRIDGHSFHTFYHRNFTSHFSHKMQMIMNKSMQYAMEKFVDIDFGFTNSDEITYVIMPKSRGYYSYQGRIQKLTSLIASTVSVKFNQLLNHNDLAIFDARVFQPSTHEELIDSLVWRHESCKRNCVSTYAREFMSNLDIHGRSSKELEFELINRNIGPVPRDGFYYGYFISRKRPKLPIIMAKGSISEIGKVYLSCTD